MMEVTLAEKDLASTSFSNLKFSLMNTLFKPKLSYADDHSTAITPSRYRGVSIIFFHQA